MSEIKTDPASARALHAEGLTLLQNNQPVAAVAKLQAAATAFLSADILTDLALAWQICGKTSQAQRVLQHTINRFPKALIPRCNLAKMLAAQNHAEEALQLFKSVPENALDPDSHVVRALVLHKLGRSSDAIRDLEFARARKPKALPLRDMLAKCYNAEKRWQDTLGCITESEAIVARYPEKKLSLQHFLMKGWAQMYLGKTDLAINAFKRVLKQDPENDTAEEMLGRICNQQHKPDRALYYYNRLIARHPGKVLYHDGAAQALIDMQYYSDAIRHLQVVLDSDPDNIPTACLFGEALYNSDHIPEARRFMETLTERHPNDKNVWTTRGVAEFLAGDIPAARASYYKAMELGHTPRLYHLLGNTGEAMPKGSAMRTEMEAMVHRSDISTTERANLHFTLATLCHKEKDYTGAFRHLECGNTDKRSTIIYDETQHLAILDALRQSSGWSANLPRDTGARKGPRAVFIVGMPRSGTSLTEQILASHSDVYGAGELTQMPKLIHGMLPPDPGLWLNLPQIQTDRLGAAYMAYLQSLAPKARCIVDKLPANGAFSGALLRAIPDAKIIWIERDAMDCCFSCYQHTFGGGLPFVYDQAELGRYARAYLALMRHWKAELPEERFMHIRYEDLLATPEEKMRQLIAFCGLEWQEQCLHFEKTKRVVLTASSTQVRKPLNKNTGGRWKPYAANLAPLLAALNGEIPMTEASPAAIAGGPAA